MNMELTEIEKQRIKLEETYRTEVRAAMTDGKLPSRIWRFLNSQFGFWLISAGLASFLAWSVGRWEHQRREISEHRRAIKQLDFEIPCRISQIQHRLDHVNALNEPSARETQVKEIIQSMRVPPGTNDSALYPEYARLNLASLVAELFRHEQALGGGNLKDLERVLSHLMGLETFFQVQKAPYSDPKKIAGKICAELWLVRWRNGWWYYSECSREKPFP